MTTDRPRKVGAALLAVALALTSSCARRGESGSARATARDQASAPSPHVGPDRSPVDLTLLYTSDEHGWALPSAERDVSVGGAAELLAHLVSREAHCPRADCTEASTLLLSGGDNYTGPAISTYFRGESMAIAMRNMGYVASALGNHEFDFGLESFDANRKTSGVVYLSGNAIRRDGADARFEVPSAVIVTRRGVRIGVIGVTTEAMPHTANPTQFEGLRFESLEAGISRGVAATPPQSVDLRVVLAHECPDVVAPVIARHPEWQIAFVGAGHCHAPTRVDVGPTPIIAPGWRLSRYARVRLSIDPTRPPLNRVTSTHAEMVSVERPARSTPTVDGELAQTLQHYNARLDAALGETIGYVGRELGKKSPELRAWVTRAWRSEMGVDVALGNAGGLRQHMPAGPITMKAIYSVLPFDNTMVILRLRGADLARHLAHEDAIYAGVSPRTGGGFELDGGAPLERERLYTVTTIDFLYEGGDKFTLKQSDPNGRYTGVDWRTPVIAWTRKKATSVAKPLEGALSAPRGPLPAPRRAATAP